MEPLEWALISIAVSLMFVTFAVSPLQKSIDEVVRNNDKVVLQEIISGINLIEISPEGTTYDVPIDISSQSCFLTVKNGIIKMEFKKNGKENIIYSAYIKNSVEVMGQGVDCMANSVKLTKEYGKVTIS